MANANHNMQNYFATTSTHLDNNRRRHAIPTHLFITVLAGWRVVGRSERKKGNPFERDV